MASIDLADTLRMRWRLLAVAVAVAAALGYLGSFLIAPSYRSTSKMIVVQTQGSPALGNLNGMAGALGINLGQGPTTLDLCAEYLLSRDLLAQLVTEPIVLADGTTETLVNRWGGGGQDSEKLDSAIDRFSRRMGIRTRPNAGVLDVSVETFDPLASVHLAQRLIDELNRFSAGLRQWTGQNRKAELEARLEESIRSLMDAEDALLRFRTENASVAHPRLQLEEMRLLREVSVQSELAQMIRVQLEMAALDAKGNEPVLKVLETPTPPVSPSWPRRGRIALISALIGMVLAAYGVSAWRAVAASDGRL